MKYLPSLRFVPVILSALASAGAFAQAQPDTRRIVRIDLNDVSKLPDDVRPAVEAEIDPCAFDREDGKVLAVVAVEEAVVQKIRQARVSIDDRGTLSAYVEQFAPHNTLGEKAIPSIEALVPSLAAGAHPRSGPCDTGTTTLAPYMSYHTWEEGVCFINNLANANPQIAQVVSIGTSLEGRTIWALKISDNVAATEPGEEKILFMGVTHAREWATHEMVLYIAEYLINRYATDPQVAKIVNNSVVWLVPVVNPDGYVHSWLFDRMYRKNKRPNGGACWGVDINRNYNYRWGYDGSGSSTDPCSETFRGPSAASEPETQAIQNLMTQQKFAISISYHTYSQLVLFPWGYTTFVTPESYTSMRAIGRRYAELVAGTTGFTYMPGQGSYTIYVTNGTSDDYAYGTHGTMAFTPEMRPASSTLGGFLLPEPQIKPNNQENLAAALWLMDNVSSAMSCTNLNSSTLIENPTLSRLSYFALPQTPINQKPALSIGLPAASNGQLSARQDDNLHTPGSWIAHTSLEMEGCGTGAGYRFNVNNSSALNWASNLTSYRVLPHILEKGAEIMISNRNASGLNVVGIPSAVPVKMSDIRIFKRDLEPPTADFGTSELILEERTAVQDATSPSPWINWSWNWVDSAGVSHLSHPTGAGGASLFVQPFRAYQFTSNVASWNFGSTTTAVYLLQFPGYSYDCNRNGVADPSDVASQFSQDCNADLVPDECQDCNNNGVGDACDLLAGTSQDTNGNGVPDECDPDISPPQPDPMAFASVPSAIGTNAISMSAVAASEQRSPPVFYFFDYQSGQGGHDSGWQESPNYVDSGLSPNSFYNYRVKARDSAVPVSNETAYSATLLGATQIETPTGVSFSDVTPTSLTVHADGTFTNVGLGSTGFYFEMTPAHGSGAHIWVTAATTTVSGLNPTVSYTFRARARNFQGTETAFGPPAQIVPGGCAIQGDIDGNGIVDGDDIAGFVRTKLGFAQVEDDTACAEFNTGTLEGDTDAFVALLLQQ